MRNMNEKSIKIRGDTILIVKYSIWIKGCSK